MHWNNSNMGGAPPVANSKINTKTPPKYVLYKYSLGERLWPALCRKTSQMTSFLGLTSSELLSPLPSHPSGLTSSPISVLNLHYMGTGEV